MRRLKNRNKKAFTLIEVLAVILLIGIIAVIITPNILKRLEEAQKNTFLANVKSMLKLAEDNNSRNHFRTLSYVVQGNKIEDSSGYVLDSAGTGNLHGEIKFTSEGSSYLAIHNEKWCATKDVGKNTITVSNYVYDGCSLSSVQGSRVIVPGPDFYLALESPINVNSDRKYKDAITDVMFANDKRPPDEASAQSAIDVSEAQNQSVMAYIIPNDDGKTYTLRIGATGGVVANENLSTMFQDFVNLREISSLDNFDKSNTTNMSYLFHNDGKLSTIDLEQLFADVDEDSLNMYSIFDANHLSYSNPVTECSDIECSLNELYTLLRRPA